MMPRTLLFLAILAIVAGIGCSKAPDPVLATYECGWGATNRLVFYASGKYEHYGGNSETDGVAKYPHVTGNYVRSDPYYVASIKKEDRPTPVSPLQRRYTIIVHDGVEYLFHEEGAPLKKYADKKDTNQLRYAYRRVGS